MFGGPKPKTPNRMVAVWSDAVMNQPGLRGVRGIGGRVHFYANRNDKPIEVEGLLTVYAYDDSEEVDAESVPVRKFAFLPEQLTRRHSISKLGHSYNLWLPFDEVGGPTRQLTLIARFEPEGGASVMSDPARQLLPGVISKEESERALADKRRDENAQIELAGYEADVPPAATGESDALETFTIDLPTEVARRWRENTTDALRRPRISKRTISALGQPEVRTARTAKAPDDDGNTTEATVATTPSRHVKTRPSASDLVPRRVFDPRGRTAENDTSTSPSSSETR